MNTSIPDPQTDGIVQPSGGSSQSGATFSAGRHSPGRLTFTALLAGLLLFWYNGPSARAQGIPPGCTGSAIGISLFSSSADVHIGDTISYSASVFNGLVGNPISCDASNIVASITTPDGVVHPITLVRTYLSHTQSDFYNNVVTYVARAQDVRPDGTLRATAQVTAIIYQNDVPSNGGANQGLNTQVAAPCIQISATCVGGVGENGVITFTGTVTNCGNNTLVGVTVTNFVNNGAFLVLGPTNLAVGQAASFSGSWVPLNPCSPSTAILAARGRDEFTVNPQTVTNSTSITCSEVLTQGIKVTKTCPEGPVRPGQLLTFSGSVSNTGNVTLTNIVVVNSQPVANTTVFTRASLVPGEVATFNGSYTAPTNCSVSDTLTATAASRCGVGVSSVISATCPILTSPQIAVAVVCPTTPAVAGGTLTYSGTVRNLGDITLNNIVVVSDRPAPNTTAFTVATLAPGASANFTYNLAVPANACSVTTIFSGRGQDMCTLNLVTNTISTTCPITTAPAIAVTLTCPSTPVATGSLITYSGTVRNTGNVILNNVTVVNSQSVPSTVLTVASLAPGASTNFTASFTTPADSCSVSSTVTASGNDNCTQALVNNSASATCTLVTTPRIVVTQNCPPNPSSLGGTLTYSGIVSNAGNVTLTNVVVTNDRTGASVVFTVATLAPGVSAPFTGSYTVPVNSGCAITSTLTANGTDKCTGTLVTANATATCLVQGAPNIAVTLSCPANPTPLGGTLTFSGTVNNSGNVTLTNVVVRRDVPGPSTVVFSVPSLAPGASANFTGSYTVPASNACSITTTVSVTANDQCVGSGVIASASANCPLLTTPSIVVTQTCPANPAAPGGQITYGGTVRNAGNITLTNITVVSSQPVPNTVVFTLGSLEPGATASFSGSYNAPLDACSASATLTATGQNQCNGNAVNNSVTTTCPLATAPQISVTKTCPATAVTEGGLLVFTGTVINTGNITLTNIFVVNNRPAANTTVIGPITLAPGAGTNFTGSYTAPLNACSVTDTLVASGRDKCTGSTVTNSVTATCPIITIPRIAVTLACPAATSVTGGPITYTGTVRNSGNVTLNNVAVDNNQAVPSRVLTVATLAPGASTNFTVSFTAPADACSVSSTVTASGQDACNGTSALVTASATCTLATTPRIAVTQNCPPNPSNLGGTLTYSGSVSNAGNVTLTNVVVTNDRTGASVVFTVATLAPGVSAPFTGSYTVPTNAGCAITSTLTANGRDKCTSTPVTASATATCPVQGAPNIGVTLACPANPTPLGGTLTFSGTVNNSGNVTLTNVVVRRDVPGPSTVVFSVPSLAPGASANFTGSYTVPASNACSITTTVSVTANDQCAGSGVIASASANCPLLTTPSIVVTQTCPTNPAAPGGQIVYGGTVRNAGNITLTNITVVSSQPVPNTVVFTLGSLEPGATASFNGTYNAPLDTCSASATLTATGQNQCNGNAVTNSVTTTCPLATAPQISVTKTCPATAVTEGGLLVFTGTVINTGNITLTNIFVVNNRPAANTTVIGPITLLPGAGTNFTGSYTAPLNACSVTDTLVASGRDKCTGSTVTNSVTATCPIITIPQIAVTLACPAATSVTGGPITYTGTVRNSGNVTLNNVAIDNNQSVPSRVLTVATLAPGASTNFTVSFTAPADACSVSSTVTASGQDACNGTSALVTASATCPLATTPRIVVTQSCLGGPVGPGELLSFSGTVMNSGNITLTNVVVTNNRSGATPVFTVATLAPGVSASFTGSYVVPTNSGCSVTSTLTGNGNDKCTGVSVTANVTTTCPLLTSPRIVVTQTCPTNLVSPGGVLTYTGSVSNAGNITLTNIVVVNNRPATNTVIFTVPSLAPGASANFTGSYQVPTNCCVVSSTVRATGRDTCTGATVADTSTATCTLRTAPRIVVTKSCPTKFDQPGTLNWNLPGELLTYTGTVSNAGDITLINVTVVNTQPSPGSPVFGPVTLAPGESASYTGAYVVPVDFCGTDVVTARGLDACTYSPVVHSVATTCPVMTTPRIAVTKNCPSQPTPRGGLFTFTGTVSNPGDVSLVNVFVVNNLPSLNVPVIGPITLAPGASVNFSGSYIAPVDCCETTDTVTARGMDRCTGSNVTATATARCPLLTTPGISVTRVCPPSPVPVGGLFTYSGSVSNTGDIVLTNVLVVSSQPNANTVVLGPIELGLGETKFFSGSYTVAANSNPATDTVTARGTDTCQARTVIAAADCSGSFVPLAITSVTLANGLATINWTATPGTVYTLQYKANLLDSSWISLEGNVTASGTSASKTDDVGSTRQRFYRIVIAQ